MVALRNNSISNYWTASGSRKEVKRSINFNIDGVKEEFLKLIFGEKIKLNLKGYGVEDKQNEDPKLNESIGVEKNKMYSKMVVQGLLTYDQGEISIPYNELRKKFLELIDEVNYFKEFKKFKYLMDNSEELLKATLNKNTKVICNIMKKFNIENTPQKN